MRKVCPELLKLGLLSKVDNQTAGVKEQKRYHSFHHKSLQEFSSAKHIVRKLKKSGEVKVARTDHDVVKSVFFSPNQLPPNLLFNLLFTAS